MPVDALIPYAHVVDVGRSVEFYRLLGLEIESTHEVEGRLVWAFVVGLGGARIMLALADGPIEASQQAVLFYCWTKDVAALREDLLRAGVDAGPIRHPFYMPPGELRLADPDGYVLLVGQVA